MISKKELPVYKSLFREIFSEDEVFCDRIFSAKLDTVFDLRKNGEIMSFLYAIPFTAKVENQSCRAIYVYGVGTVFEARGKGYMKEVFQKMETHFGDTVDFYYLVPAEPSLFALYEKIGYKTGFSLTKTILFPEKKEHLSYDIKETPQAFHSDYLNYVGQFSTAVIRSREDNEFALSEGHYHKIGNSGFFWVIDRDMVQIREAYIEKPEDLDCFLDFLARKGYEKAILTQPGNHTPYAMVKVVNPALKNASFSKGYTNLNFD
ncbi:MAG: GNAT family N-acetyltransferase [Clostridia bacterium]|nr:GNAT family N-acetyltransferase [Clostridia bacterium]